MGWILAGGLVLAGGVWAWPAPVPGQAAHRPIPLLDAEASPLRIVALGTSLTARGGWTAPLAAALTACAGRVVEVTPVARPGAGSAWGSAHIAQVAALAPDLVLVEFTINDADLRGGRSLGRARADHLALLDQLAALVPEARPVLMILSPAFGPRGWVRPWRSDHEAAYRQLAAERGLGLIDLAPLWRATLAGAPDRRALMPDGLHPRPEAVATIALPEMVRQIGLALPDCRKGGSAPAGSPEEAVGP